MITIKKIGKKCIDNPALPASLLIAGNLFLFQPALVFLANQPFLFFDFVDYLWILIPLFCIALILLLLPSTSNLRLSSKIYSVFLTALCVVLWLGTFLKSSQGVLDGKSFLLLNDAKNLFLNSFLLLFAAIITTFLVWFHTKTVNFFLYLSSGAFFTFFLVVILFFGSNNKIGIPGINAQQELVTFSKEKNVLVILLDTFQSDFFDELLIAKPLLGKKFEGFNFYRQAVSVSPTTYLAIPTIHSGEVYSKEDLVPDFYKKTLEHSFLHEFQKNGYRVFLLNPYLYCPKQIAWSTQERVHNTNLALAKETALLCDLSLFRMTPLMLKPSIFRQGKWFLQDKIGDNLPRAAVSNEMLSIINEKINTNSKQPTLKFIHSFATHPPAVLNELGQIKDAPWTRENAIKQDSYAIAQIVKLLDRLKQQEIYDNTAILIFGDHGAQLPPKGGSNVVYSGMPLFLFKPLHAKGDLQISDKEVGLIDVPTTLCAAMNVCTSKSYPGKNVLSESMTHRKFKFNYYVWGDIYFKGKEKSLITEYIISGLPSNTRSWKRILPEPLPQISKQLDFGDLNLHAYCGFGWMEGEKTHCWTAGSLAQLYLPLAPGKKAHVQFTIATHPKNLNQKMKISVNDRFLKTVKVNIGSPQIVDVIIPAALITSSNTLVMFEFDKWNNPSETDARELAVAFIGSLKIF